MDTINMYFDIFGAHESLHGSSKGNSSLGNGQDYHLAWTTTFLGNWGAIFISHRLGILFPQPNKERAILKTILGVHNQTMSKQPLAGMRLYTVTEISSLILVSRTWVPTD